MARKLAIGINWQGSLDYKVLLERVQIADAATMLLCFMIKEPRDQLLSQCRAGKRNA